MRCGMCSREIQLEVDVDITPGICPRCESDLAEDLIPVLRAAVQGVKPPALGFQSRHRLKTLLNTLEATGWGVAA